jgi:hypothetical protein
MIDNDDDNNYDNNGDDDNDNYDNNNWYGMFQAMMNDEWWMIHALIVLYGI